MLKNKRSHTISSMMNPDTQETTKVQKLLDVSKTIVFTNGTYDLETRTFIPGVFSSTKMTTGYNYREFSETDPVLNDVINFFRKIFPNQTRMTSVLKIIASFLDG